jgi:two-component system, sensor histidine kinase PdtaS
MIKTVVIGFLLLQGGFQFNAVAQNLSRAEIKQAQEALKKSNADSGKVNLLLKLSQHYILKPGEVLNDLDSAINIIDQAMALSKNLSYYNGYSNSYLQCAMAYREKGEREKGKSYANQAIGLSGKYNLPFILGESYLELSQYYGYSDDSERVAKIEIVQKALKAFVISGNIERQAFTLKILADLDIQNSNLSSAVDNAKQALSLYKSIGYKELQGVYDILGTAFSVLSDFSNSIKYGLLALQSAEAVNDTSFQICTIHNRLGISYYNAKKYEMAIPMFTKAFKLAEKFQDPSTLTISVNIVNSYLNMNMPREGLKFLNRNVNEKVFNGDESDKKLVDGMFLLVYTSMKDYAMAKKYSDLLVANKDPDQTSLVLKAMVRYFTETRQYSMAEKYLGYHNKILLIDHRATTALANRYLWFQLDSARGYYISAINYYRDYNLIQDSLYNVSKSKIVEATQIEYETAKKDQDIKLKAQSIELLKKQSQLQQNNLQRSRIFLSAVLIGVALLLVILALVYHQYGLKNKANRQISQKNEALQRLINEKEWLLKEVHHRVKNNLQTVVSLLESQSAYLQDDALLAIQDSQNRVFAMSLIHQKLYQSENVASINMRQYLPELINYLRVGFNIKSIDFNLAIAPVDLDVSQAIPVGLIVNEAVTNSIKYAFPVITNNKQISIHLDHREDGRVDLTISDNGIGIPKELSSGKTGSLGLKLIKGLAEDLTGKFEIDSTNGTSISIIFKANTPLHKMKNAQHHGLTGVPA